MDADDGTGARRNGDRRLRHIDLPRVGIAIDEDRSGAGVRHAPSRGDEGVGRNDHLVARTDTESAHGQVKSHGSVADSDGPRGAEVGCKRILELLDEWPAGKGRGVVDSLEGLEDLLL